MNCQAVQNQILALPNPRELPPALCEHVLACSACRAWAKQAARLEAILEQLPVPAAPGEKKEAMLGDLMSADPVIHPMVTPAARPSFGAVAVRFLREHATYVGGLAAAVLIVIGGIALWPHPTTVQQAQATQKDPLLEKVVAANTALARADTPNKKFAALSSLADAFAVETRGMARIAPGDELKGLAGRYETVVKDGIVPRAKELQSQPAAMPAAEKVKLFESLAAKLNADAVEAEKLAGEAPQDAQPALKRMAEVAREGEKSLRAAAREDK
jgi:hypothetical protein